MNVVVTEEQHALLFELARLDPASVPSASAFLRTMLDQVTPLLRKTVPLMRAAAEELDMHRSDAREKLRGPLAELLREMDQLDLLDAAPGAPEPQRSEDGRAKRRAPRK
ncbi:hypothetical protein LZ016_04610 [Sphingomonas sp. SM33]|uniref:Terminase small subunit n=1 Tax=Sphingomonas telluris TaxID=2907998 RepID=A0ABS9VK99_9SPHN|nr:hypothetical protein [Sphingomonas telluris]MCH8615383.1 hypothetical protein [Sphingomonas telluris]